MAVVKTTLRTTRPHCRLSRAPVHVSDTLSRAPVHFAEATENNLYFEIENHVDNIIAFLPASNDML